MQAPARAQPIYHGFSVRLQLRPQPRHLRHRRPADKIRADVGRGLAVDQIPVLEQREGGGHVSDERDAVITSLLRELGYAPASPYRCIGREVVRQVRNPVYCLNDSSSLR
jgi:hypothetical protein